MAAMGIVLAAMSYPTAYVPMLWELMRLYDWRIITYISSFPDQGVQVRKDNEEMSGPQSALENA